MSMFDNESIAYGKSPFFLRLTERNYERLSKLFDEKDIVFMCNEYIDNALVDLVNNLCYAKPDIVKQFMEVEE